MRLSPYARPPPAPAQPRVPTPVPAPPGAAAPLGAIGSVTPIAVPFLATPREVFAAEGPVEILTANARRAFLLIINGTPDVLYVDFGKPANEKSPAIQAGQPWPFYFAVPSNSVSVLPAADGRIQFIEGSK